MLSEKDHSQNANAQPSQTDWARVDALTDETIDTSDIPPLTDAFFAQAMLRSPQHKDTLMPLKNPESVPQQMRPIYDTIVELTDPFCKDYLTEEYATLARKMTAALARKRPSPLTSGKINTWACGIIYALGSINFLFDKSQKPHLTAAELCELFGVSKSTGGAKSRVIQDALGTWQLDPDWWLPSRLGDNPVVWMFEVNGFIVDIRHAPRDVQEEFFRQGLIPYVPDAPPERR